MSNLTLSAYCGTCHAQPPKYTCPRCGHRTCSLPCTQRHKLLAQCSGLRDATAYRPRRDLATPAGIDHDYNFLSAIERAVTRGEHDVEASGVLDAGTHRPRQHRGAPSALDRAYAAAGVRVEQMPRGMQRRTENTTVFNKKQACLSWTLEWFDGSAGSPQRHLGRALDTTPVGQAWADVLADRRSRSLNKGERRREHKRLAQIQPAQASAALQDGQTGAWSVDSAPNGPPWLPAVANLSFYLVVPRTPAHAPRVLALVDACASLADVLRGRLVLEFPTIYVLSTTLDGLDWCVGEQEYLERGGASHYENKRERDTEASDSEASSDSSSDASSGSSDS